MAYNEYYNSEVNGKQLNVQRRSVIVMRSQVSIRPWICVKDCCHQTTALMPCIGTGQSTAKIMVDRVHTHLFHCTKYLLND